MVVSFKKLKAAGLPKTSAKFTKMAKVGKLVFPKIKSVKIPKAKSLPKLDFSKYAKTVKPIKAKKVTLIKRAIKKVKNVGY